METLFSLRSNYMFRQLVMIEAPLSPKKLKIINNLKIFNQAWKFINVHQAPL